MSTKLKLIEDYFKPFLRLFIPQILLSSSFMIAGIFRIILVGDYGINAIASVTFVGIFEGLIFIASNSFVMAIGTIYAINIGSDNKPQVVADYWQALYLITFLAALSGMIMLFTLNFLHFFSFNEAEIEIIKYFTYFSSLILVLEFFRNVTGILLINIGLAKYSSAVTSTMLLSGAFFQWMAIRGVGSFGPWGLDYIPIVTLLNLLVNILLYFLLLRFHPRTRVFSFFLNPFPKINLERIKMFFLNGLPIMGANVSRMALLSIAGLSIATISSKELAVYELSFSIAEMMFILIIAFSMSSSTLMGQLLGKKNVAGAIYVYKTSAKFLIISLLIVGALLFHYRTEVALIFVRDPDVIALLNATTIVAVITHIFNGYSGLATAGLRALQDFKFLMKINVTFFLLIGTPIVVILPLIKINGVALGAMGFWLAFLFILFAIAIVLHRKINQYFKMDPLELLDLIESKIKRGKISDDKLIEDNLEKLAVDETKISRCRVVDKFDVADKKL